MAKLMTLLTATEAAPEPSGAGCQRTRSDVCVTNVDSAAAAVLRITRPRRSEPTDTVAVGVVAPDAHTNCATDRHGPLYTVDTATHSRARLPIDAWVSCTPLPPDSAVQLAEAPAYAPAMLVTLMVPVEVATVHTWGMATMRRLVRGAGTPVRSALLTVPHGRMTYCVLAGVVRADVVLTQRRQGCTCLPVHRRRAVGAPFSAGGGGRLPGRHAHQVRRDDEREGAIVVSRHRLVRRRDVGAEGADALHTNCRRTIVPLQKTCVTPVRVGERGGADRRLSWTPEVYDWRR